MKLKVVKYKNYGCMMESEESEDPLFNWEIFERFQKRELHKWFYFISKTYKKR